MAITRTLRTLLFAAFICGLCCSAVLGSVRFTELGQWGGACKTVATSGSYVYANMGRYFTVFDISDPAQPTKVAAVALHQSPYDMLVHEDYVFVTVDGWLEIIDVSDPRHPVLVRSCSEGAFANGMAISGNRLYLSCEWHITIVDITDPTRPTFKYHRDTNWDSFNGAAIFGNYLYTAGKVFDISNPDSPVYVDAWGDYWRPGDDLTVANGRLYVTHHGLQVLDLEDPAHPTVHGEYAVLGSGQSLIVSGDNVYVADGEYGLSVVAVPESGEASLISSLDIPDDASDIALSGNYAYVAEGAHGLRVVDISDPSHPTMVGQWASSYAGGMALSGNNLIMSCGEWTYGGPGAVRSFRVSSPGAFQPMSRLETGDGGQLLASCNYAFQAGGGQGMSVIDISVPENLRLTGAYNITDAYTNCSFALQGSHTYLAYPHDSGIAFDVVDVSNPACPSRVGQCAAPGDNYGISLSPSGYAYVAGGEAGLQVIDVSTPTAPVPAGSYQPAEEHVSSVQVSGSYAFLTTAKPGIQVLDLTNPASPTPLCRWDIAPEYSGVYVAGNRAYLSNWEFGMLVMDISDVTNPVAIGRYDAPGGINSTLVSGDNLYVTDATWVAVALQSEESDLAFVYGYVKNGRGGAMEGVRVTVNGTEATTTTSRSGFYSFYLPVGSYEFTATVPEWMTGWVPASISVTPPTGGSLHAPDIVLAMGNVSGCVRDDLGNPLEGVRLSVAYISDLTATSGSDGNYTLGDMAPGNYTIEAYKTGYVTATTGVVAVAGQKSTADFALMRMGRLTGKVRDNLGNPIWGATISGMDYLYHGDTDTDGQYLVENIPPGSYDFYLGLRSGPPVSRTLTIRPGETTTADFLVQLGGMSGTVHTPSGEPLAGATVTLYPGGLKVTTDQQGTFSFADLTPNYYDVEVTGQGLCTARYGMFVPYGDPSIIDLTVNRYASVSGTIRDKMGLPLSGVAVYLYMWANAVTDSSGRYEMTNVEPPGGPLGITATKSGYGTAERNILISEGQATICDFTMGNLLTLGQVGTCLIPGNPQSIKLRGNLAYLACGSAGLRIVDVSNPAQPVIKGICDTPGTARDVDISGNYAYIADEDAGLQIISITDPTNPVIMGSYCDEFAATWAVKVVDNRAYLAQDNSGLGIIDVSDPAHPASIGVFRPAASYVSMIDVEVEGNYVYVSDTYNGLRVFSLSTLEWIGPSLYPASGYGSCIAGGRLYLAGYDMQVIDKSDPAQLHITGNLTFLPGSTRNVSVQGQYAYLARGDSGLAVVDISNPAAPSVAASLAAPSACDLAVSAPYVYVADCSGSLVVIKADNPTPTAATPGSALKAAGVQDVTIAGHGFQSGASVKLTRPGQPEIAATAVTLTDPTQLTCRIDTAGASPGFWNVHVTNPDDLTGCLTDGFSVVLPDDARSLGTANKSASDSIMTLAAPQWRFVFWGKVGVYGTDWLTLDDGSGTPIRVYAPGHFGLVTGDYASAVGTFDPLSDPRTLISTSSQVKKLNQSPE